MYYPLLGSTTLGLVCGHPNGPPRSSQEALARMDLSRLRGAHPGSSAAGALSEAQVNQVRLRYEAFFGQTRGVLDSGWAWEDTPAAYLLLDSLALREETSGLARFLFEDFAHYFTSRKAPGQFCMLIVDEFSALAGNSGMAGRVEAGPRIQHQPRARPAGRSWDGRPGRGREDHRVGRDRDLPPREHPEEIIALAGTRRVIEYSSHYAIDGATGEGSARMQHQYKVDPNHVRSLPPGAAYIIGRGKAMKAQVAQAPQLTTPLPEPPTAAAVGESSEGAPGKGTRETPTPGLPDSEHTMPGNAGARGSSGGVPPQERGRMKGVNDLPF
jgi:hypothetical protein